MDLPWFASALPDHEYHALVDYIASKGPAWRESLKEDLTRKKGFEVLKNLHKHIGRRLTQVTPYFVAGDGVRFYDPVLGMCPGTVVEVSLLEVVVSVDDECGRLWVPSTSRNPKREEVFRSIRGIYERLSCPGYALEYGRASFRSGSEKLCTGSRA